MKTTKKLPVLLTDEEKIDRGLELTSNIRKTAIAEAEREAENKRRKGDIEKLESITSALVDIIAKGSEDRDVECEILKDYERSTVTLVRCDIGEVVEARPMTPEERQESLRFQKKDRAPVKGKDGKAFGDDEAPTA